MPKYRYERLKSQNDRLDSTNITRLWKSNKLAGKVKSDKTFSAIIFLDVKLNRNIIYTYVFRCDELEEKEEENSGFCIVYYWIIFMKHQMEDNKIIKKKLKKLLFGIDFLPINFLFNAIP